MKNIKSLTPIRIKRLREQGCTLPENDLASIAFGHRFAFRLCLTVFTIGVVLQNVPVLASLTVIAFASVVLPNHPFDYIYNYGIRHWINRSAIPARSIQLKFACGLATVWITAIIYSFQATNLWLAYGLSLGLMTSAFLVGFFDLCVPSMIFNALFLRKRSISNTIITSK
jgi:hypothetical protein